ncbi:MAG: integrase arm-type DNA-binding domain-containing protein, partial [Steroidobacteraceae bacterium]
MLTDSQVRSAKPADRPRKIFDVRGLYLHVMPNGGRYWRFNYQFNGKYKTLALGTYPDVPLVRARERHQEARRLLAEGMDPGAVKQAVSKDFEAVARAWHDHWKVGRTEHYAQSVKTRLETDIFPQIGHRPIAELSPADFRDAVRKIEQRGAFEIARRLLQNCGQIMRYAVANDLAPRNPVAEVRPADILIPRKRRNHPRVTAKELPDLLRAMDGYVGSEHTRLALQMLALTFVRTSELIGARWLEFDLKAFRWDIPAERMKMKMPHVVALSVQSLAILQRLKEVSFDRELVFPG